MTEKEKRSKAARYLSSLGAAKGGRARARALTPEQRREIGRLGGKVSQARQRKRRAAAKKAAATRKARRAAGRAA